MYQFGHFSTAYKEKARRRQEVYRRLLEEKFILPLLNRMVEDGKLPKTKDNEEPKITWKD